MVRALLRRAFTGLAVVLGVVTLMFFLIRLAPGDPALLLVGPTASEEQLAAQRKSLGLDRPLPQQYVSWLARFTRGDWGTSIATGRPVSAMISEAWPATVRLVGLSLLLSYVLGLGVGAIQAASGGRVDTSLSVVTVTLFALPGYWLGLMLVMVFTYWARALPAFGAAGFDADFLTGWSRMADRLRHLALPLTTLTLIGVGGVARYVRGAMLDVRNAPHVAVARAKGLSPAEVNLRHVLRQRPHPGGNPVGSFVACPLFGRGVHRVHLCLAGCRPHHGRSGRSAGLPGYHGGDRRERSPGGSGQPGGRAPDRMG